ncbi:hypothetical protein B0H11DRAFT_1854163 [Mycena galericulata]|nr:hypothetical protein B0H11DRAFT_1854163 [Mycena galericulata]
MSSPPAKRQRTENALITRSEIWHNDGSVVFQAKDTQFRVHWGVLSLHSSFFRDMQGLPQPPDQPSVDGCPIIELQDSPEDFEYLLKALYSPTFLTQKSLPFPAVAALVRLGRKYDFKEVLDTTVERITFENPTTLQEYDVLESDNGDYRTTRIVHNEGIFLDILTLARENNIQSALPCAYFRVIDRHPQFFHGVLRKDGTTASLASVDLEKCVLGRQKLVTCQWAHDYTLGGLTAPHCDRCTSSGCCGPRCLRLLAMLLQAGQPFALCLPLIRGLGLCAECTGHTEKLMTAGRKKMWEDLPSFFDLRPWSELKNDL